MTTKQSKVEAQAMQLSAQERADLADKLWLSVHSREEVDAAWDVEVMQRLAQLDAGAVVSTPWADAMDGLRSKLG
jgi:putative addiction module component (TIGR02574 family)